jgi:4-amino-4-deoxy-L-arabinose transferase-like glycosyltransferase
MKNGYGALTLATIACLLPFAFKAFHIDDTFYLYCAQHIQTDLFDFYGFSMNWHGNTQPVADFNKNPPLICYYIAAVASLLGWGEAGLHTAFLIPAVAAVTGARALARSFTDSPSLAAAVTLLAPAFLVSATGIMCDVMMLAFWVWGVFFWIKAQETQRIGFFLAAGCLIALGFLTKYFAIAILPLMAVYSLLSDRRSYRWLAAVAVVAVVVGAYEAYTHALYGRGLFFEAMRYTDQVRDLSGNRSIIRIPAAVLFLGGAFASSIFIAPFLWGRRILAGMAALALLTFFLPYEALAIEPGRGLSYSLHVVGFVFVALNLIALVVSDLLTRRDRAAILLALWVGGVFFFVVALNWTVSIRNLLPLVPAVGILLVRRLEDRELGIPRMRAAKIAIVAGGALSFAVAQGDAALAATGHDAAQAFAEKFEAFRGSVRFQGHWGFQYYMAARGFEPLEMAGIIAQRGDRLIIPDHNTNTSAPPKEQHRLDRVVGLQPRSFASTMSSGAGFYSSLWGSVPFVIGPPRPVLFEVWVIR